MEFVNILLLFGGAALSIPLIIHLLNRSKFDVVPWAAMHLLKSVELQNQKRLKWRSWLLLLIRCLIPLLLAICMARPLLTAWKTASGQGQTSLTVLLDDSYSMQAAVDPNQSATSSPAESAATWTQSQLQGLLKELGNSTQYSIVSSGSETKNLTEGSTFDYRSVLKRLEQWNPSAAQLSTSEALSVAIRTSESSPLTNRQLLIISDFQKADWPVNELETLLKGLQPHTQFALLPVRTQSAENLQLRLDHRFSESLGKGEPLEVRATVVNRGLQQRNEVPVDLWVDGQAIASRRISIQPQSETQVVFGCEFSTPGSHEVQLRLEDNLGWDADDRAFLAVEVIEQLQVLLVEPETQASNLPETFYWELALRANANAETVPWIQTRRTNINQLNPEWIATADVIVLANVPKLNESIQAAINQRLQEKTGLIVFPGPLCDANWYSQWEAKTAAEESTNETAEPTKKVIPAAWDAWQVFADSSTADSPPVGSSTAGMQGKPLTIGEGPYANPALAFFDSGLQGKLSDVRVFQWAKLQPNEHATIGAQLSNEAPFLVTHKIGNSSVSIVATRINDQGSNLPLRPAFVPFAQRLTIGQSGRANERILDGNSTNESKAEYLDDAQLQQLATAMNAEIIDNGSDYLELLKTRQNGKEIWRFVLLALVIFLFAELLIQRPLSEGV